MTTPLDRLIAQSPPTHWKRLARVVMGVLLLFLLWASIAELEEVAVAPGEVVPLEQVQAIQHFEGGIIEKIYVVEGDRVKKDEPLVQLNTTPFVANREELEINQEGLMLKRARLKAESTGLAELVLEDTEDFRPEMIEAEKQAFKGRQLKQQSSLSVLKEQVTQKELEIKQLEAERNSVASSLGVLQEKLRISYDLIKDKLTPKVEHLQLKSEVQELSGRLEVLKVAIPRAQAALEESKERLHNETLTFQNQATEELMQVEQDIAKTGELLTRATDQVQRATIKSSIDGVVKSLKTHTIGGVVKPGDTIMEIVPLTDNLLIEAKLDPNDIGFVKRGQKALVKILTYDYARYGGLDAEVIFVSADSHTDRNGETFFIVRVRTDKNDLGNAEASLPITAGMQATVDILTGSKSVMSYLLKPIIKVKDESFRER